MVARYFRQLALNLLFVALGLTAAIIGAAWTIAASIVEPDSHRARAIVLAYDRLGAATFIGKGRETISSYAGRARRKGQRWGCVLCRWLDELDPNHCEDSIGT